VTNVRGIRIMSAAATVVLVAYVVGAIADADLGSSAGFVRIGVLVAAVVVAVIAFQAWSHHNTPHTLSAMIVGLLGGACLASTITTATGDDLYGSGPMALVGTLAVVAAVTIGQIGQTRSKTSPR
jgi:peptidoglycan/LPS O-acetylase OafA/YrhL